MNIVYRQQEWAVLLLVSIPLGVLYWLLLKHKKRIHTKFTAVFSVIPTFTNSALFLQRTACFLFAWILLVHGLMQPIKILQTKQESNQFVPTATVNPYLEIAFLLDASQSMKATDTKTHSSRFARAKELIELMVDQIGGTPISLYIFAGDLYQICPPTIDYLYFRLHLNDLLVGDIALQGTDFKALAQALKKQYHNKKQTLFFILSDGEDTKILDHYEDRKEQEIMLAKDIVQAVNDPKSCFDTIGLGTIQGAIVPEVELNAKPVISTLRPYLLQAIASNGGGRYFLESEYALPQIAKNLYVDSVQGKHAKIEEAHIDLSLFPVSAALIFLGIGLLLPEMRRKK